MWVITACGFFSVVRKPGEELLTVRARVREDLEALRAYLPGMTRVVATPTADYAYRTSCTQYDWAYALARMAMDVDYGNFKSEVQRRQGAKRHDVYMSVWCTLRRLQPNAWDVDDAIEPGARPAPFRPLLPTEWLDGPKNYLHPTGLTRVPESGGLKPRTTRRKPK